MKMRTSKRGISKPIASPGGKEAWRELILARMPATKTYVEAYAGSATMFWAKAPSECEVLCDNNPEIVGLYKWLQTGTDASFVAMRKQVWVWDPIQFEKLKKQGKSRKKVDNVYRFKYLNLFSERARGQKINTSERARASTGKRFLDNLEAFRKRLEGVEIIEGDALDLIEKYDGDDTLWYWDPPWKDEGFGENSEFDRDAFVAKVSGLKGKSIISMQGPLELVGDNWRTTKIQRSLGGLAKTSTQTLAMNFEPPTNTEVAKMYEDPNSVWVRGGSHSHSVDRDKNSVKMGGWHSHLFLIRGFLISSEYDGEHPHYLQGDKALDTTTAHQHVVLMGDDEFETELDGWHEHDVTEVEWTAYDGLHQHVLNVDGQQTVSLTPASFWSLFSKASTPVAAAKAAPETAPPAANDPTPQLTDYPEGPLQLAVLGKGETLLLALRGKGFAEVWELPTAEPAAVFEHVLPARLTAPDLADVRILDKGTVEIGMTTPDVREWFVTAAGPYSGQVVLEREGEMWSARFSKISPPLVTLPFFLDVDLPAGKSALPAKIREEIPGSLRFWDGVEAHTAKARRFALAQVGIGPVRVVDKQLQRVALTISKAAPLLDAVLPGASQLAAAAVGHTGAPSLPVSKAATTTAQQLVTELTGRAEYFVEWPDSADARAALLAHKGTHVFRVHGADRLYASSKAPSPSAMIQVLGAGRSAATIVDQALARTIKLYAPKTAAAELDDGDEHYVLGIVLAPTTAESPDLQNDFYTAEEIRKAAHYYMEHHRHVGWHHQAIVDAKISILESHVTIADFETIAADGSTLAIKTGTWLMAFRVHDQKLWAETKAGIGGLSMGGWSKTRAVG